MNKLRLQDDEHRSKSSRIIHRLLIGVGLMGLGAAIVFFIDQTRNEIAITNLDMEHFQLETVRIIGMYDTRITNSVSATPGAVLANLISEPQYLPPDSIVRRNYRQNEGCGVEISGTTQNSTRGFIIQSTSWGNRISIKIAKSGVNYIDNGHSWLWDFVLKTRGWIPIPSRWLL